MPQHASKPDRSLEQPCFRQLELQTTTHGDQPGILLLDPLQLSQGQVFVPEGLLPIVSQFDGKRSIEEIEQAVEAATGAMVPVGFVRNLVEQLDQHLVLDSERLRQALAEASAEFMAQSGRPASHAGSAGSPLTAGALREALTAMVGRRPARPIRPSPKGLLAPHIDLARGREGYSLSYSYLAESEPADLYVVFGTGHQGPASPLTGLTLDWETPLGRLQTDRDLIQGLHGVLGEPGALDLLLHRQEHSIEFQMLFLAHLLKGQDFQVAGFLTGKLPFAGHDPLAEPYLQDLLAAFAEATAGRRVCYIAGADLAHLGPFFGDPAPVDQSSLEELAKREAQRLQHLQAGNPAAFLLSVEAEGNPDRVCGTAPIFLTAALASGKGEFLHYGQAPASDGSQVVSYCSMAFPGDSA